MSRTRDAIDHGVTASGKPTPSCSMSIFTWESCARMSMRAVRAQAWRRIADRLARDAEQVLDQIDRAFDLCAQPHVSSLVLLREGRGDLDASATGDREIEGTRHRAMLCSICCVPARSSQVPPQHRTLSGSRLRCDRTLALLAIELARVEPAGGVGSDPIDGPLRDRARDRPRLLPRDGQLGHPQQELEPGTLPARLEPVRSSGGRGVRTRPRGRVRTVPSVSPNRDDAGATSP